MNSDNRNKPKKDELKPRRARRPHLPRLLFTLSEAAAMLGQKPGALRRTVERRALKEGDELVAHLSHGITAKRHQSAGRWLVHIPEGLLGRAR